MSLQEEAKQVVAKVFGPSNAAKVDVFAQETNPDVKPKEFLDKCINLLASILGPKLATDKFKNLIDRYLPKERY